MSYEREELGYRDETARTGDYTGPEYDYEARTRRSDRSPDEIQREIDRHRDEMERTIGAMESKISPDQILDQAVDYIRRGPGEYFTNLGDTVKHNPIPAALVGIGLSWLAASGRYPHDGGDGGNGRETARRYGAKAGEKASELSHRAREGADSAAAKLSERAEDARYYSRRGASSVRRGYRYVVEDQPLLLGALGIAVGLAMGASLPHTETEDELMGDKRDDLLHRAKEAGKETAEEAKETAKSAGKAAEQTVRERTGMGEESHSTGRDRVEPSPTPGVATPIPKKE